MGYSLCRWQAEAGEVTSIFDLYDPSSEINNKREKATSHKGKNAFDWLFEPIQEGNRDNELTRRCGYLQAS